MNGITKDEMKQIARECGLLRTHPGMAVELAAFTNAILERAAVECEETDLEEAKGGNTYYAQLGDAQATRDSISVAIRALKINTGD